MRSTRRSKPGSRRRLPPLWPGLLAAAVLATGLARPLFHAVYERLAGVEVLGPYAVRIPPEDSPYQRWLEDSRGEIPEWDGLAVDDVHALQLQPWPAPGNGVRGRYLRLARYLSINAPDLLLNLGLRYTDQLETEPREVAEAWERLSAEPDRERR